jgi:membrane protein YdbS with pleckstrin-like domain
MTLGVYRNQDFYAHAHSIVSIVDGLHSLYRGLKNIFVGTIVLAILFIFIAFTMLFINPLLLFLVWLLKRTKPTGNFDFSNSDD